mgnify:CR=1 FL=1
MKITPASPVSVLPLRPPTDRLTQTRVQPTRRSAQNCAQCPIRHRVDEGSTCLPATGKNPSLSACRGIRQDRRKPPAPPRPALLLKFEEQTKSWFSWNPYSSMRRRIQSSNRVETSRARCRSRASSFCRAISTKSWTSRSSRPAHFCAR